MILSEGLEPMLYNLEDDLSERNNLAKQHPELVQQLTKEIEIWQKDHVQPWWVEADKWTKKRKKDYQKFRDAKDFLPL